MFDSGRHALVVLYLVRRLGFPDEYPFRARCLKLDRGDSVFSDESADKSVN